MKRNMLTGKSLHNVGVERLNRDVYIEALSHFASIFHNIENGGFLNPDNDAHCLCTPLHLHPTN